jgi:hypothetical protein
LSIPSFASERCRAMTAELVRTLESIAPTDDQALEDRALACFVVACGELALMRNAAQRDTVVEQLTLVGRKLVKAGAAEGKLLNGGASLADGKLVKADTPAAEPAATMSEDREEAPREIGQGADHLGMTWDQLEAILKQEKAARETSLRLSTSFP